MRQKMSGYQRLGQSGGSKGGKTTAKRYGHEFYQSIGKKGGEARKKGMMGGSSRSR